jgi:hypothetical protein
MRDLVREIMAQRAERHFAVNISHSWPAKKGKKKEVDKNRRIENLNI